MKLLIIGASPYQHYIYDAAKDHDFEVFAIDGNPSASLFKKADHYKVIDIYDTEAVVKYAREAKIEVVTTINIDQAMVAVSRIQRELDLPHKDEADVIASTRKDLMRSRWKEAGLINPEYWVFREQTVDEIIDLIKGLNKTLFLKPVDNAAKRGISKVSYLDSREQLDIKIRYAYENSKVSTVILEEFIDGDLYFVPTYIAQDGKAIASLIKQTVNENFVQIKFDAPVDINDEQKKIITDQAIQAGRCFGSGPYHTEVLLKDNIPYLVETSPRISYATVALTRLIEMFDPVVQLLSDVSGLDIDPKYNFRDDIAFATLKHLSPEPGKVYNGKYSKYRDYDNEIYEIVSVVPEGHIVEDLRTNVNRVMYFVTFSNDKRALEDNLITIENWLDQSCFIAKGNKDE